MMINFTQYDSGPLENEKRVLNMDSYRNIDSNNRFYIVMYAMFSVEILGMQT